MKTWIIGEKKEKMSKGRNVVVNVSDYNVADNIFIGINILSARKA